MPINADRLAESTVPQTYFNAFVARVAMRQNHRVIIGAE